jgi:23S rRNA G2069 N7-methylase RlmK/C1962 C5-methylase RlmI
LSDPTALANRLRKNAKHLRKWARREQVVAYRLYDRDIPEFPLAIDWYDGRVHVSEYASHHFDDEDGARLRAALEAVRDALEVSEDAMFVKRRERQRGTLQYERVSERSAVTTIEEAGLLFEVNLSDYLDTGIFLDHRPLRAHVGQCARGADVLNLFAYTGTFSVHAAAGGARSTLSVDLSTTYLDWAERNLRLNRLSGAAHRQLRADVTTWLADEAPTSAFDLVVLDPPTFSNSKRMDDTFDVQRDHSTLIRHAMRTLRDDGTLFFSTNRKRFRLAEEELEGMRVVETTHRTVPLDFARSKPHQSWEIRHSPYRAARDAS